MCKKSHFFVNNSSSKSCFYATSGAIELSGPTTSRAQMSIISSLFLLVYLSEFASKNFAPQISDFDTLSMQHLWWWKIIFFNCQEISVYRWYSSDKACKLDKLDICGLILGRPLRVRGLNYYEARLLEHNSIKIPEFLLLLLILSWCYFIRDQGLRIFQLFSCCFFFVVVVVYYYFYFFLRVSNAEPDLIQSG